MLPLEFTNRLTQTLPADDSTERRTRSVTGAAFSRVKPDPVEAPRLLGWSREMATTLGLAAQPDAALVARVFSGNQLPAGADPHALCYGGHQFGHWAGQLGDGRAICLGEVKTPAGQQWEIQLKGAGATPYSRHADGRAVLRSSLREFVCSEAMHHLGIPTTRALCLVETGERVVRDMFYDGHPEAEPGAITTRVAPSFLRFGNLELPAARRDTALLRQIADFALTAYYPHLGAPDRDSYLAWYEEINQRTCDLMLHWMRVGFVHGVMNTDNLSLLGLTIDYGPYGWLDSWDPGFTPNTSDTQGRYCYANQPHCAAWNLACLGNALVPLVGDPAPLTEILHRFQGRYETGHRQMMADKLGLPADLPDLMELVQDLESQMARVETDFTLFFRMLTDHVANNQAPLASDLEERVFYSSLDEDQRASWSHWLERYARAQKHEPESASKRHSLMQQANPVFIPRNFIVHGVIEAAESADLQPLDRLMQRLRAPYEAAPDDDHWVRRRPDWARQTAGCSALSCSS